MKRRFKSEVKHSIFLYYCVIRIASNQRILKAVFQYWNIESWMQIYSDICQNLELSYETLCGFVATVRFLQFAKKTYRNDRNLDYLLNKLSAFRTCGTCVNAIFWFLVWGLVWQVKPSPSKGSWGWGLGSLRRRWRNGGVTVAGTASQLSAPFWPSVNQD